MIGVDEISITDRPTVPCAEAHWNMDSWGVYPLNIRISELMTRIRIYVKMNIPVIFTISEWITLPLILKGIIAFGGALVFLIVHRIDFKAIMKRICLMPPAVEPDELPIIIAIIISTVKSGDREAVSVIENPVAVSAEIIWNMEMLKDPETMNPADIRNISMTAIPFTSGFFKNSLKFFLKSLLWRMKLIEPRSMRIDITARVDGFV